MKRKEKKKIKDYVKSFGRVPVAPPVKVVENKKRYKRSRSKKEMREILKEEGL